MSAIDQNKAHIENYEKGFKIGPGSSTRWGQAITAISNLADKNNLSIIETGHLIDILSRMKKETPSSLYINAIEHELVRRFREIDPTNDVELSTAVLFHKSLSKDHHLLEEVGGTESIKVAYLLTNPALLKKESIDQYFTRDEIEGMGAEDQKKLIVMLAAQPFGEEQIKRFFSIKQGYSVPDSYLNAVLPDALEEQINNLDSRHFLTPLEQRYLTPDQLQRVIVKLLPDTKLIQSVIQEKMSHVIGVEDRRPFLIAIAKSTENTFSKNGEFIRSVAAPYLYPYRGEIKPFEVPSELAAHIFQEAIKKDVGISPETNMWLFWALANDQNWVLEDYLAAKCSPLLSKKEIKEILFWLKESHLANLSSDLGALIIKQEGIALERIRSKIASDQGPIQLSNYLSHEQIKGLTKEQIEVLVPAIGGREEGGKALMILYKESPLANLSSDLNALIIKQEEIALERIRSKIASDQGPIQLSNYLSHEQIKGLTKEQIEVLVPAIGGREEGGKALMILYKEASTQQRNIILTRLVTATAALIDQGSTEILAITNLTSTLKELYKTYKEPSLSSILQTAIRRGYQAAKRELSGSYQAFFLQELTKALSGQNAFNYLPVFLYEIDAEGDAYIEFVEKAPFEKTPPVQVKNHINALHRLHTENRLQNSRQVTTKVLDYALAQKGYTTSLTDPINIFPPGKAWILTALTSDDAKTREKGVEFLKKAVKGEKPDRSFLNHLFKRDIPPLGSWKELNALVEKNQGSLKKQLESPLEADKNVAWCLKHVNEPITKHLTPKELKFISSDDAISLAYIACCQPNGSKDLITLYQARDDLDQKGLECYLISNLVEYLKDPSPERETVYQNTIAVLKEAYGTNYTTILLSRFSEMYPNEDPFTHLFNFVKPNSYAHPQPLNFLSTAPLEKTPPGCLLDHLLNLWVEYRSHPFEDINTPLNRVLDFSLKQESFQKLGNDPYDIVPPTKLWLMQALISDDPAIQDKAIRLLNKAFNPTGENGPIPSRLVESLTGVATTGQTWSQLKQILTSDDLNRKMSIKLQQGFNDFKGSFR